MKIYILITTLFISALSFSQTPKQGMKKLLNEKTKGDNAIPVKNTTVKISLNDSIQYTAKTDNQGMLDIETPTGKFAVKVKKDSCQTIILFGVVVGENKKAYMTFDLTCEKYLNSLTKK
jgi:hypothetical protein